MSQTPPPFPYPTSPQSAPAESPAPYGSAPASAGSSAPYGSAPAWGSSPAPAPVPTAGSASEATGAAPVSGAAPVPGAPAAPSGAGAASRSSVTGTGASSTSGESLPVRLLKSLVDFSFRRSLVADAAGILYGLWILAVLLHWLGWIIFGAIIGFAPNPASYWDSTPTAPWLPILIVLLGWIPALLAIVAGRAVIELFTATVRAARDTRESTELLARLVEQTADGTGPESADAADDLIPPTRTHRRTHA